MSYSVQGVGSSNFSKYESEKQLNPKVSEIQTQVKNLGTLAPERKIVFTKEMLELFQEESKKKNPDRDLLRASAYAYGRCIYGGDMSLSAQYLQASLVETLFKEKNEQMEDLYQLPVEKMLPQESDLIDLAAKSPEEGLFLAQNLRWLGHTFQNISWAQSKTEENIRRFDLIYDGCEKVLSKIVQDKGLLTEVGRDANWELIDLLYNTTRFRYGLSQGDDPIEKLKTLHRLKVPLDLEGNTERSLKIRAQIENIMAVELRGLQSKETDPERQKTLLGERWKHVCNAVEIVEKNSNFPDLFLAALFFNNKAAVGLEFNLVDAKDARPWAQHAVDFAAKNEDNHFYFAMFYGTAAKAIPEKAQEYLEKGLKICEKFPDQTKDQKEKLQKQLSELK